MAKPLGRPTWQWKTLAVAALLVVVGVTAAVRTYFRYQTANTMVVALREYSNAEYPEDPSGQSVHHRQYDGRMLTLVKKDARHFDFVFEPRHPHIAKAIFRDVDVSLMTPSLPDRAKSGRWPAAHRPDRPAVEPAAGSVRRTRLTARRDYRRRWLRGQEPVFR